MTRSRSAIADAVDALVRDRRIALTETRDGMVLNQLLGVEAKSVLALLAADGWEDIAVLDEAGDMDAASIEDEDAGITVRARKPGIPENVEAILTRRGLGAALARQTFCGTVWLHGLGDAIETFSVRFAPWGDITAFIPDVATASPRKVVRVLDDGARFPDDLSRWLLRDSNAQISGRAIAPWRRMAVERLGQSLANEIEPDGRLLFRGPPVARFTPIASPLVEGGSVAMLQRAAGWVFESPREVENRHALFAAEVARSALIGGTVSDLGDVAKSALEGARIAYNFGVVGQSRDTLKALADLRKAVGDETAKLAENTRGLATAVAGSVVANLGIIVARLTVPATSKWVPAAAIIIGLVLALYVASIAGSGVHYLKLQESLRSEWRHRLYRFLDEGEYERMVTKPVASAETGFWIAICAASIMTVLLFVAVWLIAGSA